MSKQLLSGAQALAEGALAAGCRHYFGCPLSPQSQVGDYLAQRLPQVGGSFVQVPSEPAALGMLLGAAMAGARVLTSSSSPGLSLIQEGISHLAALELPVVIADFARSGPGLGNDHPAQSDYFQATRGGGHGDYRSLVLAPDSVQELCDLTIRAFDLADTYRNPVLLLADGLLAGLKEPVELPRPIDPAALPAKDWALGNRGERPGRTLTSYYPEPKFLENHNYKLVRKYDAVTRDQVDWQSHEAGDARLVVVAYGSAARIARGAIARLRERGLKVGLFRPITLWPFPAKPLKELCRVVRHLLVVELNAGQMVEDVRLAVAGRAQVNLYARPGGVLPSPDQVAHRISHYYHQARLHEQDQGPGRGGGR